MINRATPQLQLLAKDKYQCADLSMLHQWLEAHGYRYYGHHAANEYGRFACQETHTRAGNPSYIHSYIQVLATGELYAPDPHPRDLLPPLVIDAQRQRSM